MNKDENWVPTCDVCGVVLTSETVRSEVDVIEGAPVMESDGRLWATWEKVAERWGCPEHPPRPSYWTYFHGKRMKVMG
jgi:hypothetical protein